MKTIKENIKESINKLDIAKSRLEENPSQTDIYDAMKILTDVLKTLEKIQLNGE